MALAGTDVLDLYRRQIGGNVHAMLEQVAALASALADLQHHVRKDQAPAGGHEDGALGIEQVNNALNQMDEVTQQNSALVEENAATAKTLEQQAAAMDERIAFFQLDAASNPPKQARPAAPRPAPAVLRSPLGRAETAAAIAKDPDRQEF